MTSDKSREKSRLWTGTNLRARPTCDGNDLAETIGSLTRETCDSCSQACQEDECDAIMCQRCVDARWFVPQSRPRVFVVASSPLLMETSEWGASRLRPQWIEDFAKGNPGLGMQAAIIPDPPQRHGGLEDFVEHLPANHELWWDPTRTRAFLETLSPIQAKRVETMRRCEHSTIATAYRRTRGGKPVWEVRGDGIAGCLRTGRGGSSRQALVQVGKGDVQVRWMTSREYAYLQGARYRLWSGDRGSGTLCDG